MAAAQQYCGVHKPVAALQQPRPWVGRKPAGRSLKLSVRAVAAPERPPTTQVRGRRCKGGSWRGQGIGFQAVLSLPLHPFCLFVDFLGIMRVAWWHGMEPEPQEHATCSPCFGAAPLLPDGVVPQQKGATPDTGLPSFDKSGSGSGKKRIVVLGSGGCLFWCLLVCQQ